MFAILCLTVGGFHGGTLPGAAQDLFLRGGRLVDPESRTVEVANLWIEDGRIAGRPEAVPEGFDGPVIDLEGRWVIPGLRDLHTHSMVNVAPGGTVEMIGTAGTAHRMLYSGVTGFLDLFNLEDYVLGLRDRQRASDEIAGADVFAAGPCLTAPEGHCTEYPIPTRLIENPDDARREIAELAAKGPDVVKLVYEHVSEEMAAKTWRPIRPSIDRATLDAAVAAATEHGIPTVVHIRSWEDVADVARAWATAVTHLPSDRPVPNQVLQALKDQGTYLIPTLSTGDPQLGTRAGILEDPGVQAVTTEEILAAYRAFDPQGEREARMLAGLARARKMRSGSLRRLARAGIPIVVGTDAGNPWTLQGWSLHRELELLVAAGLTPWQALAAATTTAGDLLGRSWGLEPGDPASLVILDASPIESIGNTRKIHRIVHHGRLVDREAILASQPPPPRIPRSSPPSKESTEAESQDR